MWLNRNSFEDANKIMEQEITRLKRSLQKERESNEGYRQDTQEKLQKQYREMLDVKLKQMDQTVLSQSQSASTQERKYQGKKKCIHINNANNYLVFILIFFKKKAQAD